jgi:hypothetical protein
MAYIIARWQCSYRSQVSNTGWGSRSVVLIEAGGFYQKFYGRKDMLSRRKSQCHMSAGFVNLTGSVRTTELSV